MVSKPSRRRYRRSSPSPMSWATCANRISARRCVRRGSPLQYGAGPIWTSIRRAPSPWAGARGSINRRSGRSANGSKVQRRPSRQRGSPSGCTRRGCSRRDMANARNVLIVADASGQVLGPSAYELLALAQRLAGASGGEIGAVLLGDDAPEVIQTLAARGAHLVLHASAADPGALPTETRLPALTEACARLAPCVVLLAHDLVGAELA